MRCAGRGAELPRRPGLVRYARTPPWTAAGYESHWSRLIDAGLAGFFLIFRLFADAPMAERLMSTAWPMLWMLPSLIGIAAIAWRLAGRDAALIALLLAVFCLPGLHPFRPGRIDHHNGADRIGAAGGRGDAVGRPLPLGGGRGRGDDQSVAGHRSRSAADSHDGGAALGLRYVADASTAKALRDYGVALAAVTLLAFLVSVAPAHWTRAVCDALAINYGCAVIVAGLGVVVLARPSGTIISRLVRLIGVGVAATAIFAFIEPQCLRGPYAQMDPGLWPIWLGRVAEMQPLPSLIRATPAAGIAIAAFPALAVTALLLLCRHGGWRNFSFAVAPVLS